MLILIAPGDPVFVSGMAGGPATVVKQNGSSVRVRMASTGKARTATQVFVDGGDFAVIVRER